MQVATTKQARRGSVVGLWHHTIIYLVAQLIFQRMLAMRIACVPRIP